MITEQLTARVSRVSEYTAECTCHVFCLDGREVLQAYKGYWYESAPKYSEIWSEGTRKEICKEAFNAELNRILSLN